MRIINWCAPSSKQAFLSVNPASFTGYAQMYSDRENKKGAANFFLSWQFLVFKLFALALVTVYLAKPTGSLSGRIAFEQEGFHLYTFGLGNRSVSAVAIGPRGSSSDERGVWVREDGTFKVEQLPVGEYELRVRAPGFGTEYYNDVYVDEGQTTEVPNAIRLSTLSPSVSLSSNVRVYTTKEAPSMWAQVSASKHVEVKIYKKDFAALSHSAQLKKRGYSLSTSYVINHDYDSGDEQNPFKGEKPTYQFTREIPMGLNDSQREDFAFSKPLPPGDYVAVAEAKAMMKDLTVYSTMSFTVTDLGIIVKKAPDLTLVRAIDLNTLQPVAGAKITCQNMDSTEMTAQAQTDKDGFAAIKMSPTQRALEKSELCVIGTLGLSKAYDGINYWEHNADHFQTYTYNDRPVYRLGQTVYFKGILRKLSADGLKNPGSGLNVHVSVENPDSSEISSLDLKTSDHGTFNGSVKIPDGEKTGNFQLLMSLPDGSTTYGSFEVAQYRKPEFQVEVTPSVPRVVAGTQGKVHVKASYYFGAPVANAKIKYSIYSSPDWGSHFSLMPRPKYYEFFDDWSDDDNSGSDWYASNEGGGDYLSDGTVQTDGNGEADVSFDTSAVAYDPNLPYTNGYGDKRYRVEAEVTDLTRMTVVSSGSILVTPADFEMFVTPDSYVNKVGDKFNADISAIGYDGKPMANQPVTVHLERFQYDRVNANYRGVDVKETKTVTTDSNGNAKVSFVTSDQWPCDRFYIVAESNDKTAHTAWASSSIWVANERYPYIREGEDAAKQALQINLDKKVYKPGDTAKIMVTAPLSGKEGVQAIVSVEGTHIYSYKLQAINATAQLVEVPIKPEYVPNAFITVTFVGNKHQFFSAEKMIKVSPQNNFLNITVATDKQKYKPGEKATYTIKATKLDGTPAPNTEVSLGVVDESIYAIRPDTTENIQKFFYSRRANWVITSHSFPEEYSGGPDKTEPRVRKDFKDTADWLPNLKTNKDGIAIATIKLPDNLTTWRATVRGVDMATDVGAAMQKITVTQDLIVRLGMPRFFTQDDQGTVSAVVHNYTDRPQSVKVTFTPSPEFSTQLALVQTLLVQPDKASRFDWPITATQPGVGVVRLKAVGQTASDAVEQKIPIRPLGIPAFSIKGGVITDDNGSVQLPIGMPKDAEPGTQKYQVSLASSSIGPVLGNFDTLIEYPYGCTEQTMSRMVPSIVAFKLHKSLGLPIAKGMDKKFDDVYGKSIEKLEGYRHADGGWGWWQNDDSQPYLTSLVLENLNLMNSTGRYADPHKEWIQGGLKYLKTGLPALQKQLSDPQLVNEYRWWDWYLIEQYSTDMSYSLYTISLFEKPPADTMKYVFDQYKEMPPEGLAYLTMALKNSGDNAKAQKVYDRLISIANVNGDYMDWDHTPALISRLYDKGGVDWSYRFTGVESTALALRAVLAMEPNNFKRVESIKQWLLLQHDNKDGWENTKTTAAVFEVLLQEELISRSKWPVNFTADANIAEKLLNEYLFNPSDTYKPEKMFNVPVGTQPQTLTITKKGTGRLYYSSLLTFFRKLRPGDKIADKATPQGLHLERKFFRLTPEATKSDGTIHFRTVPITDGKIKAGETVLMKVFVDSPVALPYVMLEAALPSGAEVADKGIEDQNLESEDGAHNEGYEGDWAMPWWTHQDVLDDRIVFFCTSLKAGKSEFHTMLRMESPGSLNVDPVSIEGMYTKKVRGYSELDSLTVAE
jgi:hypothetical protein